MAAPTIKTTTTMSGKWAVNRDKSDSLDPVLTVQGIGYLTRKAVLAASITVEIKQYDGPPKPPSTSKEIVTHLDTSQTASGLITLEENQCLDDVVRDHTDWIFGLVKTQAIFTTLDGLDDEFLKNADWLMDGEGADKLVKSHMVSKKGWVSTQVWGFRIENGERRLCVRAVVINGEKRATAQMVYDYISG